MQFQFNVWENGRIIVFVNGCMIASLEGEYDDTVGDYMFCNPNLAESWSINRPNIGHENKVLAQAIVELYKGYKLFEPYKQEFIA